MIYAKALGTLNVITEMLNQFITEFIRRQLKNSEHASVVQGRNREFPSKNLKAVVVRHPFQRYKQLYNCSEYKYNQLDISLHLALMP